MGDAVPPLLAVPRTVSSLVGRGRAPDIHLKPAGALAKLGLRVVRQRGRQGESLEFGAPRRPGCRLGVIDADGDDVSVLVLLVPYGRGVASQHPQR